jgi:hypothetical protein
MVYLFIKPKPAETLVIEGILHFSIEYLIKNKIQASKKIDRKLQVEQHVIAIKGTKAKTETPATKLLCLSSQSLAIKQQSTSIPTPASVEKTEHQIANNQN